MKEEKYKSLLQTLNLTEDNLLLRRYFDVQFDMFIKDKNNFSGKINDFIEAFTCKIDTLYLDYEIIHFTDYHIADDNLRTILKLTCFKNNITQKEKHKLLIINKTAIYESDKYNRVEKGVYLLDNLKLFSDIYYFFLEELNN